MAKKKKELPVFLLNGFLECGKTTLIKEICENNPQYHDDTTLIIVCEEGEIEYEQEWLDKYKINIKYVDDQSELTPKYLEDLDKEYAPDRIVIEYNSFFDWDSQEFPEYMVIYQQITLINAQTFSVMFNNMKKLFQKMVEYSSLVVFNRCEGIKDLSSYRRWIRGLTQQAQIAFEESNGSLTTRLDEDLPYDLSKDEIHFEEDIYPTWYVEVFDNYEKYFNKIWKFKCFVRDLTDEGTIVVGYDVMTCCAQDIQFLGYEVIDETNTNVKIGDCIYLECEVKREFSKLAGEEVVMLHAKKITKLPYEKPKTLSLS